MRIYKGTYNGAELFQPGQYRPDIEAWRYSVPTSDESDKVHIHLRTVAVTFRNGVAEVDDLLGSVMIEQGLATAAPAASEAPASEPAAESEPAPTVPATEFDDIEGTDYMRIHGGGGKSGNMTMFVSPGRDCPDIPGWSEEKVERQGDAIIKTRLYRQFTVKFERGVAEVDKALGRYMVRKGLASAWPMATIGALLDSRFNACDTPPSG